MLLAQRGEKNIDEAIVELLHQKGQTGPVLLETLGNTKALVSKETFYRVLRKLQANEIVNKHGAIYQLNRHWLQRIYRFSKEPIETNEGIDADNIFSFKEGDKIRYTFKNPNLMGIYWAHTYDMLFEKHDPKIPILIFHPHEWLIHTRPTSETFFLNRFQEDKKLAFFSIGGRASLDKQFKEIWASRYLQINNGIDHGIKKTEYINVLGDFIFKVSVSKNFSNDLETFFKEHMNMDQQSLLELEKICNRNDSAKMLLTRSKKEASKWQAKFKKHFYIPSK